MEWWRTLVWLLRGNAWGVVFMAALIAAVIAFVPVQGGRHGGDVVVQADRVALLEVGHDLR